MNVSKSLTLVSATVMIATALPALAERPGANGLSHDRRAYFNPPTRYAPPVYRRNVVRGPVEVRRTVVVERRTERSVGFSRPIHVRRPVYVARRPIVYQDVPVHPSYNRGYSRAARYGDYRTGWGTLGGAMVGAVIGSQVADPAQRAAGTIAGAVIGGIIGNGLSR